MTTKEFNEAAKKFKAKINGYNSMIKIKIRKGSIEDCKLSVVFFDVALDHLKVDPFLNSACLNITDKFRKTCEAEAKRIFNQKVYWNNTSCIFWICND